MEHEPRKITGYLVDVTNGTAGKTTIEKSLEGYYRALSCDCIDITQREIGGRPFSIICDDEALLKIDPRPSALSRHYEPLLFGNLFIVKFDGADDVTDLTNDEIEHLKHCTARMETLAPSSGVRCSAWPILTKVNNYD